MEYLGEGGIPDIRNRLSANEDLDALQNDRLDALEAAQSPRIERSKVTFNNAGNARYDFEQPFDDEPTIVATAIDDDGRAISVQFDRFYQSGGQYTGVRIVADRMIELPGLLSGLFGFRVARRDRLNGSVAHVVAIG